MVSAGETPATRALSPLKSAGRPRLPPEAAAGANGASIASMRFAIAEARKWNARSAINRPTVGALSPAARDAPLSSGFGTFIAGESSQGELSAACAASSIVETARKANGKDDKSALSFGSEW
jgi:hypothetical protein